MLRLEIKDTVIEIRAGFFLVVTLMLMFCDSVTVIVSLVSSLLHELGHIAAMLLCKEKIERLVFYAPGLRIDRKTRPHLSFSSEIIIALSGVTVNFALALCAYITYLFFRSDFYLCVCAVNLVIAVFNLLPVESLDGARGLEFILLRRIPENSARKIMNEVSLVTTILLIIFFSLTVYLRLVNPSFTFTIIYLLILLINRILQLKKSAI